MVLLIMEQRDETIARVAHTRGGIWPVGKRMRKKDGSLLIAAKITGVVKLTDGLTRGYPIWVYTVTLRPATEAEFTAAEISKLQRELGKLTAEASDYRNQDELNAERRSIRAKIEKLEGDPA